MTIDNFKHEEVFTDEVISDLLEFKSEDGKYYFRGYLSTPDIDLVNDMVTPECMSDMLGQINKGLDGTVRGIKGSHDHDVYWQQNQHLVPISKLTAATMDTKGILVEGMFNTEHPDFKSVWNQVQNGFYDGLSIEYAATDFGYKEVNGKKIRVLNKLQLKGYGHTPRPANPHSKLTDFFIKSLEFANSNEIKEGFEKLTPEKIDYFIEDEDKASKEYAKYGLFELSNDERRHYMFFKNMKTQGEITEEKIPVKEEAIMTEEKVEVKAETQPIPQTEVKTEVKEEKVAAKAEDEKSSKDKKEDEKEEKDKEEEKCDSKKVEMKSDLIEQIKSIIREELKSYVPEKKVNLDTSDKFVEVKSEPTTLVGTVVNRLMGGK